MKRQFMPPNTTVCNELPSFVLTTSILLLKITTFCPEHDCISTAAYNDVGCCFIELQKGCDIDKCGESIFGQFVCAVVNFRYMYCLKFKVTDNFLHTVIDALIVGETAHNNSSCMVFVGVDSCSVVGW